MPVIKSPGKNSPFMAAWEKYKASQAFAGSRDAGLAVEDPKRVEGAMWAAFVEGYQAAGGVVFEESPT